MARIPPRDEKQTSGLLDVGHVGWLRDFRKCAISNILSSKKWKASLFTDGALASLSHYATDMQLMSQEDEYFRRRIISSCQSTDGAVHSTSKKYTVELSNAHKWRWLFTEENRSRAWWQGDKVHDVPAPLPVITSYINFYDENVTPLTRISPVVETHAVQCMYCSTLSSLVAAKVIADSTTL